MGRVANTHGHQSILHFVSREERDVADPARFPDVLDEDLFEVVLPQQTHEEDACPVDANRIAEMGARLEDQRLDVGRDRRVW